MNDGIEGKNKDVQAFWGSKELPSDNPSDYAVVTFYFDVNNTTIFDSICKYMFIDSYDESSELLVATCP